MSTEYRPPITLDNGGIELDTTPDSEGDLELIATLEDMHVAYLRPADQIALRDLLNRLHPPQPRTVSTVEELDALPVGAVVRTAGGDGFEPRVAVKDGYWRAESEWFVADADDACLDSTELDDLPATVLHEGDAA